MVLASLKKFLISWGRDVKRVDGQVSRGCWWMVRSRRLRSNIYILRNWKWTSATTFIPTTRPSGTTRGVAHPYTPLCLKEVPQKTTLTTIGLGTKAPTETRAPMEILEPTGKRIHHHTYPPTKVRVHSDDQVTPTPWGIATGTFSSRGQPSMTKETSFSTTCLPSALRRGRGRGTKRLPAITSTEISRTAGLITTWLPPSLSPL